MQVNKIAYIAAPYSSIPDKHELMRLVAKFSGQYMINNPDWFAITGLVHHYASLEEPKLGTDYSFWVQWCELFMTKCDKLVVLCIPGWETSVGVQAEIEYASSLNIPIEYCYQV